MPVTTQTIADNSNSVARLGPKPTFPNVDKAQIISIRRANRVTTWMVLKLVVIGHHRCQPALLDPSSEVFAEERRIGIGVNLRNRWAANPCLACRSLQRINECGEDRESQVSVARFDCLIQPFGQFALTRECAVPIALV